MMKLISTVLYTLITLVSGAQIVSVPGVNFEQSLIDQGYDVGPVDGFVYFDSINQITSLNVNDDNILDLTGIEFFNSLEELYCTNNSIEELDLSQNANLKALDCRFNQLYCLNVKNNNNTNFTLFETAGNTNLYCVEVDNPTWSENNWVGVSSNIYFLDDCLNGCSNDPVGVQELYLSDKKLVQVTDLLGRKIESGQNSLEIHVYDDGTSELLFKTGH